MNTGNLKGTAMSAVKGVQKKAARARLYCEALEVDGAQELLSQINVLAEQTLELIEGDDGEAE